MENAILQFGKVKWNDAKVARISFMGSYCRDEVFKDPWSC